MSPSRRDAVLQLGAVFAGARLDWSALLASAPASDPLGGTIAAFHAGRARGAWSSLEVTQACLARARALNDTLHAVDQFAESALAEARASDARQRRRALRGPLDGVPVFAKAIYDVAGLPTTGSNAAWAMLFPAAVTRDAIEVTRMRAAGAVVLGKTAADDFAYHGSGTSTLTGQVRNPHDSTGTRTPGGSSAGSAVSVACGFAFAALGTDDGGSNRIPAQFTGVVGMKPTFGLVPRNGVIPTWPVLDTHGPLARTVADAAVLLDAIAGPDAEDGLALTTPWRRGALPALDDRALQGARLGLVTAHASATQGAESIAVFERAMRDCQAAGAVVAECAPTVNMLTYRTLFREAATARGDVAPNDNSPAATANALLRYLLRQHPAAPPAEARAAVRRGLAAYRHYYDVLPAEWEAMAALIDQPYEQDPASLSFLRSRAQVVAQLAETFRARRLDAMVYPTMPFTAFVTRDGWPPNVRTALSYGNWLGLPEVSVPAGHGADGMPAGNLSFVGLPGSDRRLLALAHAYEHASHRFMAPTHLPAG